MATQIFLIFTIVSAIAGLSLAYPEHAKTTRAPMFPLAVRTPHASVWLGANELPGNWPKFWTTKILGWTGMVQVDGVSYIYMGNPNLEGRRLATQRSSVITPTQTYFTLTAGPVDLNVTFFSPVEYSDIMRQSIPLSYVFVDVASNDGNAHQVQLYMDISGEWATADDSQIVTWRPSTTPQGLKVWTTELNSQYPFQERNDYPRWGQAVLATSGDVSHGSGSDVEMRSTFVSRANLDNTTDTRFRCASCDWPTFAFSHQLGAVSASSKSVQYIVGHVREVNANFLGNPQPALWVDYWPTLGQMIDFFSGDVENALRTANELDVKILNDAYEAAGQDYADILATSLRQAYAGNEFSGTKENPILYQKEISSGAFMQTVDVIYPAAPVYYYLNVTYLRLLLDPLFYMMENQVWTKPFAMHDIGAPYPNGLGQAYGGDMPIEESADMIMMVANYAFHPDISEQDARDYVRLHFPIMSQWAEYLHGNCLYPTNQLSTDDFIGPTELNSGLALKGILGMATFSKLANLIGETNATNFYADTVRSYVPIWLNESMHVDRDHLKMEYNVTNGYQFKYNAYYDKMFDLGVVPEEIYKLEADYYLTKLEPYGIPFVNTHDYTKSDWEIWTAAAFGDANPELKSSLIHSLALFLKFSAQRIPFTDWYVTATTNQAGFQARPVVGGHFAILSLNMANAARAAQRA